MCAIVNRLEEIVDGMRYTFPLPRHQQMEFVDGEQRA